MEHGVSGPNITADRSAVPCLVGAQYTVACLCVGPELVLGGTAVTSRAVLARNRACACPRSHGSEHAPALAALVLARPSDSSMLPHCHVCTEMQWIGHAVRMRLRPRFTVTQQFTMVHGSCCCSSNTEGHCTCCSKGGYQEECRCIIECNTHACSWRPSGASERHNTDHAVLQLAAALLGPAVPTARPRAPLPMMCLLLYDLECRACALLLHPSWIMNGVYRLLMRVCHTLGSPAHQKPQRSSQAAAARLAVRLLRYNIDLCVSVWGAYMLQ